MNGVDIVARLREREFPGKILMVSGRFTSSDMSALTRLGIDHSLTKDVYKRQELAVTRKLHLSNIRILGRPFDGFDIQQAFAVHTGDTELLARLNEGLALSLIHI